MDAKTRAMSVLAELYPDPTARQAAVEGLGEAGLVKLGESVLRQDEFSRSMADVTARTTAASTAEAEFKRLHEANTQWFADRQRDLQELEALRKRVPAAGGNGDDPPAPEVLTKEEFGKAIAETERGAVAFFTDLNALSLEHYQRFGQVLDTSALIQDKRVQQIGLRGVYQERYKPQLDELATKARQAAEQQIRDDERRKVLTEQGARVHPYPVRGNEPSALDAIEQARSGQTPQTRSVDDMVAEYARLGAARTGAST